MLVKRVFIVCFFCLCVMQNAVAVKTQGKDEKLRTAWGISQLKTDSWACQGTTDFGDDRMEDSTWKQTKEYYAEKQSGVLFYIATDIYAKGARFCPFWVQGYKNYYDGSPYIRYRKAVPFKCFTACVSGSFGEGCSSTTDPAECNDNITFIEEAELRYPIKKEHYSTPNYLSGVANSEVSVFYDFMHSCKKKDDGQRAFNQMIGRKDQEHHVVLAISEIDDKEINAGTLVIRAGTVRNITYIKKDAWPVFHWINTNEKTLYPDGWKKNGEKVEHVDDAAVCKLESLCSERPRASYNPDIHTLAQVVSTDNWSACNGKYVYKCKDETKAFPKTGGFTCDACDSDIRSGQNKRGVCTTCEIGQYIKDGECVEASSFGRNDMVYGPDASKKDDLDQQCWLKDSKDDYIKCTKGKK